MQPMAKIELTEWAKAGLGMLGGAFLLAYFIVLWAAGHHFFLIPKAEAEAKYSTDAAYSLIAINPADEFAGQGTDEWKK